MSAKKLLKNLHALVADDFTQINQAILKALTSQVPLVEEVSSYLVDSGGKRLRPLLHVLTAKALSYQGDLHITLAAILEFIHTATLLHDDVIDVSTLRRGQPTANAIYGNASAVLVGDFLYSRAFQLMVSLNSMQVMDILATTTNTIAEGEVLQLSCRHNPDISESMYHQIIYCKTAKLFEASTLLAGVITNQSPAILATLRQFGSLLGQAFQLIDDMLDYTAPEAEMGKHLGDDLAEGKATLPYLYALAHAKPDARNALEIALKEGKIASFTIVQEAIQETGAIEYTLSIAKERVKSAQEALLLLPSSPYRDALWQLTEFSMERRF